MTDRPAGWYRDPQSPGEHRYWDGASWVDMPVEPETSP
ncbi:MAG: hypothetical protein JWR90_956 [Marmoricola sp.]|jgi:hypothetical protein|nr:hypothetical protein [Marmoricola sp.]